MLVKFTNAAEQYKGNVIYINPSYVSALYEFSREPGGSLITMIYGGPTGVVWEVEESLATVLNLLNGVTGSKSADSLVVPKTEPKKKVNNLVDNKNK